MREKSRTRRAKPLLGTLVSISAQEVDEPTFIEASDEAFAQMEAIHVAMSFHEHGSDVRVLTRKRAGEWVKVSHHTANVLQFAMRLEQESNASFNACCARELVSRGLLPYPDDAQFPAATSLCNGIEMDGEYVRVLQTPWIDLGGIAKGYAVDVAIDSLKQNGIPNAVVNAGGDLRVFGEFSLDVHVRSAMQPELIQSLAEINDMACATSAVLTSRSNAADHIVRTSCAMKDTDFASVSVFAPLCMLADALTKIVWSQGHEASELLAAYDAQVWVQKMDGSTQRL